MARSKVYKSKAKPIAEELPSDDEIDAFDKQKDFVGLDPVEESESDDLEDKGLYDLSDDAEDSDEDEFDSDDSDAEGGTLGKRTPDSLTTALFRLEVLLMSAFEAHSNCTMQLSVLKRPCAIRQAFSKERKETKKMIQLTPLTKTSCGAKARGVTMALTQRNMRLALGSFCTCLHRASCPASGLATTLLPCHCQLRPCLYPCMQGSPAADQLQLYQPPSSSFSISSKIMLATACICACIDCDSLGIQPSAACQNTGT